MQRSGTLLSTRRLLKQFPVGMLPLYPCVNCSAEMASVNVPQRKWNVCKNFRPFRLPWIRGSVKCLDVNIKVTVDVSAAVEADSAWLEHVTFHKPCLKGAILTLL